MFLIKLRIILVPIFLAALLAGCGGGGGGGSSSSPSDNSSTISGNAVKGVVQQGIVNAYRIEATGSHAFIGATRTNQSGQYSLDLEADKNALVLLELRADEHSFMTCDLISGCIIPGTGQLADFGETFQPPENFSLLGIKLPESNIAFISPLSHIIATTAAHLEGGITVQNIQIALEWLQLDLRLQHNPLLTETPDITRLTNSLNEDNLSQGVLSAVFFYYAFDDAWTGHTLTLDDLSLQQLFAAAADLASNLALHYSNTTDITSEQLSGLAEANSSIEESYSAQGLTIFTQPNSNTLVEGETIRLRVSAGSDDPIQYQWYKGSTPIPGANANTLLITDANESNQGLYHVEVFDGYTRLNSLSALVTVHKAYLPLQITSHPQSQSLSPGQSVLLNVDVIGGKGTIDYQWRKGGSIIPGARSSSLAISNVSSLDAGRYSVTVTDDSRILESQSAVISVSSSIQAITIHDHPESAFALIGGRLTLYVNASGGGYLGYQWRKDGVALAGQNSSSLNIDPAQTSDEGSYDVVVSNSQGSAISNLAQVSVLPADTPITIQSQPQSTSSWLGGSASFHVYATAGSDIRYQWYHNGNPIPDSDSASLRLENVEESDTGVYAVSLQTDSQTETSLGAVLSISEPASIELSWDIPVARENGDSLGINDIEGYRIQYGLNATSPENSIQIAGATTTSHTIEDLFPGTYYLRIATIDSDGIQGAYSAMISIEIQ